MFDESHGLFLFNRERLSRCNFKKRFRRFLESTAVRPPGNVELAMREPVSLTNLG